jgi:hypothetical protein
MHSADRKMTMLLAGVIGVPVAVSLAVIAACFAVTTLASLRHAPPEGAEPQHRRSAA